MINHRQCRAPVLSALLFGTAVALACTVNEPQAHHHHAAPEARAKAITPLWIGPAFSGSWYTPSRSGEGFIVQVLDNGSVVAIWFTFPPEGSAAQQAWIFAQGGMIDGNRVRFDQVFTTRGPRFGAGFDPAARVLQPWGTLELTFSDCNTGEVSYAGPTQWGSATRAMQRNTAVSASISLPACDRLARISEPILIHSKFNNNPGAVTPWRSMTAVSAR